MYTIISFSRPRTGSTKQYNIYKASIEFLVSKKQIVDNCFDFQKFHPSLFEEKPIEASVLNNNCLILSVQRPLLEQIASFVRINNIRNINSKTVIEAINFVLWGYRAEFKTLNLSLLNKANFSIISYSSLRRLGVGELISNSIASLDRAFSLRLDKKVVNLGLQDTKFLDELSSRWGLESETARNLQSQMPASFSAFDENTGLHGNHIAPLSDRTFELVQDVFNNMGYSSYADLIDNKQIAKIIKLAVSRESEGLLGLLDVDKKLTGNKAVRF